MLLLLDDVDVCGSKRKDNGGRRDFNRGRNEHRTRLRDYIPRKDQRAGKELYSDNGRKNKKEEEFDDERRGDYGRKGFQNRNRYHDRQSGRKENKARVSNSREEDNRERVDKDNKEKDRKHESVKQKNPRNSNTQQRNQTESRTVVDKSQDGGGSLFTSSKVFSLSGQSNRLVVKEIDNNRRPRGRGRGRGLRYKQEMIPPVGRDSNDRKVDTTEGIGTVKNEGIDTGTIKNDGIDTGTAGTVNNEGIDTGTVKNDVATTDDGKFDDVTDAKKVDKKDNVSDSTDQKELEPLQDQESPETDKTSKPKRYSSRRQKGGESDAINEGHAPLHEDLPKGK